MLKSNNMKKLICINLALILMLALMPISAMAENWPYFSVGNSIVYRNTSSSGSGWSYDAETEILTLNWYDGGTIRATGDLTIYLKGNNIVTGDLCTYAAGSAIQATGTLEICMMNGTTYVYADDSKNRDGGVGISAKDLTIRCDSGNYAEMIVEGGSTSAIGYSGGCGIEADRTNLNVYDGKLEVYGGSGKSYGGPGIRSHGGTISLLNNSVIRGGRGSTESGCGINVMERISFSGCTMTVSAYSSTSLALAGPSGSTYNYYECTETEPNDYTKRYTATNYTVTLNANGGKLHGKGTAAVTGPYYSAINLDDYVPTRSGYTFAGWNESDGDDEYSGWWSYGKGGICRVSPYINTLQAEWIPNGQIGLFANSQMQSVQFTDGSGFRPLAAGSVTLPGTEAFVHAPSNFIGWTETPDSNCDLATGLRTPDVACYAPGETADIPAGTVLYAQWRAMIRAILYHANGGYEVSTGGNAIIQDVSFGFDYYWVLSNGGAFEFARDGYVFAGWNTKPDGSGETYAVNDEVPVYSDSGENFHLYAQWHSPTVTVTLDGNGGTASGGQTKLVTTDDFRSTLNLGSFSFSKDNFFEFSGWNTKPDGSGTSYSENESITLEDDMTLYAQWTPKAFSFDGGNGSGDAVHVDVYPGIGSAEVNVSAPAIKGTLYGTNITVAAAVYGKNGKLIAVKTETVTLDYQQALSTKLTLSYPTEAQPMSCRAFVMDSSFKPKINVLVCNFE